MISIQCDGCYTSIKEEVINSQPGEVTVLSLEVSGLSASKLNTRVKTFHLCKKCKTTRRTIYLDNPFYVEPPEDASDERKASQGN